MQQPFHGSDDMSLKHSAETLLIKVIFIGLVEKI